MILELKNFCGEVLFTTNCYCDKKRYSGRSIVRKNIYWISKLGVDEILFDMRNNPFALCTERMSHGWISNRFTIMKFISEYIPSEEYSTLKSNELSTLLLRPLLYKHSIKYLRVHQTNEQFPVLAIMGRTPVEVRQKQLRRAQPK